MSALALVIAVVALIVATLALLHAHDTQIEVEMLVSRTPVMTDDGKWLLPHVEREGVPVVKIYRTSKTLTRASADDLVLRAKIQEELQQKHRPLGGMARPKKAEWYE